MSEEKQSERWHAVEDLYHAAMELREDQRAAYLDRQCGGDEALRVEVESLLAYSGETASWIDKPAIEVIAEAMAAEPAADPGRSTDPLIGRKIAHYRIVAKLASGGMGDVYRAVRADDTYEKEVALKLVSAGRNSPLFVERFRNERQILAGLDHPNIARLYDGGTTEDGIPYFVMELVDGENIDAYCARHRLSVGDRLSLFLQVCSAVEYAHRHLIIHRDIKPGNIFVTPEGVAKLLDFGIAKIVDTEIDGEQNPTMTNLHVFTPAYASPEQVKGEPMTTASDVYSLGVVLYELLTGGMPYRSKGSAAHEISRQICETAPAKPSEAVPQTDAGTGTNGEPASTAAPAACEGSVEKLSKRLRGDLDTIILHALRKEPDRRYASVEKLAEDIRRHLDHLPVLARNDSFGYQASKFVSRHKLGVAATAVSALLLVAGVSAIAYEAHVARVERARAERRFEDVHNLANSLLFEIHDSIRDLPGSTASRKLLVDRARKYLDSLANEAGNDANLERDLASAYDRVGDVQGGPQFANLGDTAGAVDSYRKAVRLREILSAKHSVRDQGALGYSYVKLGTELSIAGDSQASLDALQHAYAILESLKAQRNADPHLQDQFAGACFALGGAYANIGDLARSVEFYRTSIAVREHIVGGDAQFQRFVKLRLAGSYGYMSGVVHQQGDLAQAVKLQTKARDILAGLYATNPDNATIHQFLLQGEYWVGYYLELEKMYMQALPHLESALAGYAKLAAADPNDSLATRYLALCYGSEGAALAAVGDVTQGIRSTRKAVEILDALSSRNPSSLGDVANARMEVADAYAHQALKPGTPVAVQIASWRSARIWYEETLAKSLAAKQQGDLGPSDIAQPEKIDGEIARCKAALARLKAGIS